MDSDGYGYHAFGLALRSNLPIPELTAAAALSPDCELRFLQHEALPAAGSVMAVIHAGQTHPGGDMLKITRLADAAVHWRYPDGVEFLIAASGETVHIRWTEASTFEDVCTYLLGPVLGYVLRRKGRVCLHSNAWVLNEQAFAFIAPAGGGKSTLAAALAQRGYTVLTDDVLPLQQQSRSAFAVWPAYPRIRLWGESADALYGDRRKLPRICPEHPDWDKRYVDLSRTQDWTGQAPVPLAAIYVLADNTAEQPAIRVMEPKAAMLYMTANSYTNYALDKDMRQQEFECLSDLAEALPVRRVERCAELDKLDALVDLVTQDARAIQQPNKIQENHLGL